MHNARRTTSVPYRGKWIISGAQSQLAVPVAHVDELVSTPGMRGSLYGLTQELETIRSRSLLQGAYDSPKRC
jgi:hypothetical protein